MKQNEMTPLMYTWKDGIWLLIPLPVPKAWESGAHRNSNDHLPLFKVGMDKRDVP